MKTSLKLLLLAGITSNILSASPCNFGNKSYDDFITYEELKECIEYNQQKLLAHGFSNYKFDYKMHNGKVTELHLVNLCPEECSGKCADDRSVNDAGYSSYEYRGASVNNEPGIFEKAKEAASNAVEAVGNKAHDLKESAKQTLSNVVEKVEDKAEDMKNATARKYEDAKGHVDAIIHPTAPRIVTTTPAGEKEVYDYKKEEIETHTDKVNPFTGTHTVTDEHKKNVDEYKRTTN